MNTLYFTFFAVVITFFLFVLNRWYNFRLAPVFGMATSFLFILSGALNTSLYNTRTAPVATGTMIATVIETPQAKTNSYKSLLCINTFKADEQLFGTNELVLVYFEKTDNISNLSPGSQIIFKQQPEPIENDGNLYEFDYKSYLARKHIYRQVYLKDKNWKLTGYKHNSPLVWADNLRNKLLAIYHAQNMGAQETEILSALTLGYKRDLDKETKRVFSSAGAMHVLAVSGLHVGILFIAFSFFFGFLQKRKSGKIIYVLLSIGFLWTYAFITGLSPSVLRACTMFSLIIIAGSISRRANIYNTLAASAFILLLVNPNNLFEVGFQLSYAAVFGIVFLQPRLVSLWPLKNRILLFFWNLTTVSIAAQIATFPLTAYYFNQFPTYFLLSNLIVIPAAMLLIPLGLSLLLFSNSTIISAIISTIVKWIIKTVYFALSTIECFPHATPEVVLLKPELLFVLLLFFSFLLLFANGKAVYLKMALTFGLLLIMTLAFSSYRQYKKNEIIVLNSKDPIVCLIASKNMYVISTNSLKIEDYLYSTVQNIKRQKRLKTVQFLTSTQKYRDELLLVDNGLIVFEGKKLLLSCNQNSVITKISPDMLITLSGSYSPLPQETNNCTCIQYYRPEAKSVKEDNLHILSSQGAYATAW
ncbi:MAG TPA: ComEC/Rec2 family competence protein [Draconibacterium sp.]|nr:ComEC/Rec2 family competence protein [Draconibacterium sp.]